MKRKLLGALVFAMILTTVATSALACTPMAAGKLATKDGSVLVAQTCDSWYDNRIQIIPGATYPEGTMVDVFVDLCLDTRPTRVPHWAGQIPQATSTYTYFHIGYPFMNEKNVVIGEHTWSGRQEAASQNGLLYIANLEVFGLQRGATAKEVVQVMGELAETYGYGDGGESLLVGDPNEVWVFEITGAGPLWTKDSGKPGAHWVARRLADDEFYVAANRARIGVIDFEDPDNYMWSTNITEFPKEMGWWEEGTPFHYANIFNPGNVGAYGSSRREWRAFDVVAPSLDLPILDATDHYPFSVKPDEPIDVQTIMGLYRDHLDGTDYDMHNSTAAFAGNPNRGSVNKDDRPEGRGSGFERTIGVDQCSYSFVAQTRDGLPSEVATVLWFAEDSADTSVYVPIYSSVTEIPKPWTQTVRHAYDRESAWWAFNLVNNWANLNWNHMFPTIQAKQASYEEVFFAQQAEIEAKAVELVAEDPALAVEFLTNYTYGIMDKVEKEWWDFAFELIGRYQDFGWINDEGNFTSPQTFYTKEQLEASDFGVMMQRDTDAIHGTN